MTKPCTALFIVVLAASSVGAAARASDGAAGAAPPEAFAAVADTRPASVPATHVHTPGGYYHRDCVIEVADGERIRDLRIERTDGTFREIMPCLYPRYDRSGRMISPAGSPTNNNWMGYASFTAGALNWVSATFAVPSNPSSVAGQTLYFFPGSEPTATFDRILQPVLAWNGAYATSGWAIYSWNYIANNAVHSTAVSVAAGENISGYLMGTHCHVDTGICDNWQVRTAGTNVASTLDTTSGAEVLNWLAGGVLEVYNVTACNQYPPSKSISFQNVSATRLDATQVNPVWTTTFDTSQTPRCVTGVAANGGTVNINWCIPSTSCVGKCGIVSDGCFGTLSCPLCCPTCGCRSGYRCCEPGVNSCNLCVPPGSQCP